MNNESTCFNMKSVLDSSLFRHAFFSGHAVKRQTNHQTKTLWYSFHVSLTTIHVFRQCRQKSPKDRSYFPTLDMTTFRKVLPEIDFFFPPDRRLEKKKKRMFGYRNPCWKLMRTSDSKMFLRLFCASFPAEKV